MVSLTVLFCHHHLLVLPPLIPTHTSRRVTNLTTRNQRINRPFSSNRWLLRYPRTRTRPFPTTHGHAAPAPLRTPPRVSLGAFSSPSTKLKHKFKRLSKKAMRVNKQTVYKHTNRDTHKNTHIFLPDQ